MGFGGRAAAEGDVVRDDEQTGWAMGSGELKKDQRACLELGANDAKEIREIAWESTLEEFLTVLGMGADEIVGEKKSAAWKIAAAGYLKTKVLNGG